MNISKRMPLAAVAVAIAAFGAGCLDQESPVSADRAVVRRAVLQETLACASGDRTLELQDAIERIKSAGGGTLKLWSKAECPAGYEYSTHPHPLNSDIVGCFNGLFHNESVAGVTITIQSTRTPAVPNSTRIDTLSQDLALLWTNGCTNGVAMQNDTFRYLEFRGPDWNNTSYVDWELPANFYEFGISGAKPPNEPSNWVIDHSVIRGFRNNGVHANSRNATVQHSVIMKNARSGLGFASSVATDIYAATNNLIMRNGNDGIDNSGHATIRDNTILDNGVGEDRYQEDRSGILVWGCVGGLIENNVTRGNERHGILVQSCKFGTSTWTIKGNRFGSNGAWGIALNPSMEYPVVITSDNVCEAGNGFGCFNLGGVANGTYQTPNGWHDPSYSGLQAGTSVGAIFDDSILTGWGAGDHQGWVAFSFQETTLNNVYLYTGSNNAKNETFLIEAYRDGQLLATTGHQQRQVRSWAQDGGWLSFPIAAGTYDRLVIRAWGWRYPDHPYYWNDPEGGAWVGVFAIFLGNVAPTCGNPAGWGNITYSGLQSGTSGPAMFDGNLWSGWGAGNHQGWVAFTVQPTSFNRVKIYAGSNSSHYETFLIEGYRNGQLVAHTNYQERLVLPWAQGGGWVEFPIAAGTYDRLVIREWGWRYPAYTNYWDDPQSGAWVGVNELQLCSG